MTSGTDEGLRDDLGSTQGAPHGGAQDLEDDGYMLTIRFKERPLIWIAIAILAVLVTIEGLAMLSMGGGSSTTSYPHAGEMPDPADRIRGMGGMDSALSGGNLPDEKQYGEARAPESTGPEAGVSSPLLVTGDEAVSRVQAYLKGAGAGLDKADADELLVVIGGMNTAIEALDARFAKGEIDPETYGNSIQDEQQTARLGILRILGWQKSSVLLEALSGSTSGK